jgi:hypothetical protein
MKIKVTWPDWFRAQKPRTFEAGGCLGLARLFAFPLFGAFEHQHRNMVEKMG